MGVQESSWSAAHRQVNLNFNTCPYITGAFMWRTEETNRLVTVASDSTRGRQAILKGLMAVAFQNYKIPMVETKKSWNKLGDS